MKLQRAIQLLSLGLFLWLLGEAAFPLATPLLPVDLFLRLDPLGLVTALLTGRQWIAALWPGLLLLAATPLFGRFFCGYLCPLGTTIDGVDALLRRQSPRGANTRWPRAPYLLLAGVLGAALAGVSLSAFFAPISLATRLYGTTLYPVLCQLAQSALAALRPIAERLGIEALLFLQPPQPRVAMPIVSALLLCLVFIGGRWLPRFWCRNLCPAGALLAILSRRPWLRRSVSPACSGCGRCQARCPMAAIDADPRRSDSGACIVCQTCVAICPESAIRFPASRQGLAEQGVALDLERRALLGAGLLGASTALVSLTGLDRPVASPVPGDLQPPARIRPPGAMPEPDFLARCVRCGLCLKACPTNTLQPAGLLTGLATCYTPQVTPRRGGCEPLCHTCAEVCPTAAIRLLPAGERPWAKIGTAHILRHKCLAWEVGQRCLVCDEGCPFDAISLQRVAELAVAVPVVDERRCAGCGFCEHLCPVQALPAIVVEPMGALRLASGSVRAQARGQGLDLQLRRQAPNAAAEPPTSGLPPGFSE